MQVKWDKTICQHAGVCVGSLPQVFSVKDGALAIDTGKAEPEAIRRVVEQCPSGALTIQESE
jgi:uncharacterized Fe-S cluster protein YjdI